jgi:hypothetical protein
MIQIKVLSHSHPLSVGKKHCSFAGHEVQVQQTDEQVREHVKKPTFPQVFTATATLLVQKTNELYSDNNILQPGHSLAIDKFSIKNGYIEDLQKTGYRLQYDLRLTKHTLLPITSTQFDFFRRTSCTDHFTHSSCIVHRSKHH